MTISYPLTMPQDSNLAPKTLSIDVQFAQASSQSPTTLSEQIFDYQSSIWRLSAVFPSVDATEMKTLRAFLLGLKGRVGTFLAGDPGNKTPLGNPSGTPLVKGAGQLGYSLIVDGLTPSLPRAFAAGDAIQIGYSMYIVINDVASNGSGECTLDIVPPITDQRGSPADNAPVITSNCKQLFRLEQATIGYSEGTDKNYEVTVNAVEAI